jgi:hypothetical protein
VFGNGSFYINEQAHNLKKKTQQNTQKQCYQLPKSSVWKGIQYYNLCYIAYILRLICKTLYCEEIKNIQNVGQDFIVLDFLLGGYRAGGEGVRGRLISPAHETDKEVGLWHTLR